MEKSSSTSMEPQNQSGNSMMNLSVKFAGQSIPVEISSDSTVRDLKEILQTLTNVLPRGQKLICKGKLMVDEMTLKSSEVASGSKIMLVATKGLHQGDGPIKKEAPKTVIRRPLQPEKRNTESIPRWKFTGIMGFVESNLKSIPEEVWTAGSSLRVLDLRRNSIRECPARIGQLTSMEKLLLDGNGISDESISWEGIASLKFLATLSLNQNCLRSVPSDLGALTSLKNLELGCNELTFLPSEIGLLTKLEILKANNNRLYLIPESIGGCISLVEVDLSCNLLIDLPDTLGMLKCLKALKLSNNGLKSLPSCLFKMCGELSILDLHATQITMDILRQIEGWEEFDTRRMLKQQKKLDFRVTGSDEFDEGADSNF